MGLIGDLVKQVTSPLTDGVSAISDALHGDFEGALKEGASAVGNGVMDASMLVAPETAPEELALKEGGESLFKSSAGDLLGKGSKAASLLPSDNSSEQA